MYKSYDLLEKYLDAYFLAEAQEKEEQAELFLISGAFVRDLTWIHQPGQKDRLT